MPNKKTLLSRQGRALHQAQRPQSLYTMMKCVLLALPFTVLLGALALSASTALLLFSKNPIRYADVSGMLCLYLTAALGGASVTRFYGRRSPVLCGLSLGLLLMLFVGFFALFAPEVSTPAPMALLLRLFIPIAALAGALLAARKRKTRYRRVQKR